MIGARPIQAPGRALPYYATCARHLARFVQGAKESEAMNVLFLCTGNCCRSILAEATFNHLAPAGWRAMSAGTLLP
jgi:Low molecular weight phosphotyrosine protein phosphatase